MDSLLNLVNHPGFIPSMSRFLLWRFEDKLPLNPTWPQFYLFIMADAIINIKSCLIPDVFAERMNDETAMEAFTRLVTPALEGVEYREDRSIEDHIEEFLSALLENFKKVDYAEEMLSQIPIPPHPHLNDLLDQYVVH